MTEKYRICVPEKFFDDHAERDLPCGDVVEHEDLEAAEKREIVGYTKRGVVVDCTIEEVDEWLSDSYYYSYCVSFQGGGLGKYMVGLQTSARATVQRLVKQFGIEGFLARRVVWADGDLFALLDSFKR